MLPFFDYSSYGTVNVCNGTQLQWPAKFRVFFIEILPGARHSDLDLQDLRETIPTAPSTSKLRAKRAPCVNSCGGAPKAHRRPKLLTSNIKYSFLLGTKASRSVSVARKLILR